MSRSIASLYRCLAPIMLAAGRSARIHRFPPAPRAAADPNPPTTMTVAATPKAPDGAQPRLGAESRTGSRRPGRRRTRVA